MPKQYELIADDLRQQITSGEVTAGARLSSETALAEHYRVGLPTLREALRVLQVEGLIEKRHGRGNFVRASRELMYYPRDPVWPKEDSRRHEAESEQISSNRRPEILFSCHEVKAGADLALRMRIPKATPLIECVYRVWSVDGDAPFSIVRSYLPHALAADVLVKPLNDAPPWGDAYLGWLASAGIGLDRLVERLTARPPTMEETAILGITAGVSVLVIQRTAVDTQGEIVETADLVMSGDRVAAAYTTPITRIVSDG